MNDSSNRDVVVFTEAIELPADKRAAYLEHACGGDVKLRQRVEALLHTHDQVGDFLEQPAPAATAETRRGISFGEKPGDWIGRYKLLQQIGEGGCGVVFMAEQEEPIRRRVALKIIKPGMDTKSVIARFEAERQALALMDHPNIAKVLDAGATESGRPYFVMELVRGVKITEYCDENSLTTEERLNLFVQVCQAVQHAHQKGVIHRDIKPSNILVTKTLEDAALPVVIDFGIAKATTNQRLTDKTVFTAFEMLIGTPAYMSPEQAALTSVDVDTRTDIYSLGVLLYELLTGSTPFDAGELLKAGLDEVRRVIREQEPVRPSTRLSKLTKADLTNVAQHRQSEPPKLIRVVCGDLDWIAMKALEKNRTRRYETASSLALDVQRYLSDEPISARPPSALYKFQKTVQRNKLLFVGIGVIGLLLVVGLIIVSASLARERLAHRQTEAEAAKSEQVTQFLEDMLRGVGPSVARGRDTTILKEILDKTTERVGKEITNQPSVEAELSGLIGQVYYKIGDYDQAEAMQRAALALNRKIFGSESKETAMSLNDLGLALDKEGNLPEAESVDLEAIAIRQRIFGSNNETVATSLNNLASVYRHQKKLKESERLTREALEIRTNSFGNPSLQVADSLHNLSVILGDEGRQDEAEKTARELLAMRQQLLNNDDELVAAALADVAWAAAGNGKLDESKTLETKALAIQRQRLGDEHPDVARSVSFIGQLMRRQGKLTDADAVLSAAVSIQSKLLGEDHPDTLGSLDALGLTLEDEGKWTEAEAVDRQALALWRKRSGDEGPQALWELQCLVRVLIAQKKFAEAEQLLGKTLTPGFTALPSSASLLILRVELMARQGRWQDAVADATLVLKYQPTDHNHWNALAMLLAITHNRPAYDQFCRKFLTTFANTANAYVAERLAKDCLLLPNSKVDLGLVSKIADTAVTVGKDQNAIPLFQCCKALAEYRQGHYQNAIEWAQKSLGGPPYIYTQAEAYSVLAMAHFQLKQDDEAKAALAQDTELIQNRLPKVGGDDLGSDWPSWVFNQMLAKEAKALIQPAPTTIIKP